MDRLCNTCGGCYGICPTGAIHFDETTGGYYLPVVNTNLCNYCGLCMEICPGIKLDPNLFQEVSVDPFIGNSLAAYVGIAKNKQLYENSQSGGVVSALLAYALETKIIKGAVTAVMKPGIPPRPTLHIAKTIEDVYSAQKSKYCPIPLLGFLKELEKNDGPVAVVGISCQIQGLRNIIGKLPRLKSNIAFTIGLVCDRIMTFAGMDYLLDVYGEDKKKTSNIHFRDKMVSGYPGDVHIISDEGKSIIIPYNNRMRIKDFFTPARCRICFDKMNVLSDITVGDPHGLQKVDRKNGESVLVVRSELGQNIVNAAQKARSIEIRSVDYQDVLEGQKIDLKRKQWRGWIEAWKENGYDVPNYYEPIKTNTPRPVNHKKYKKGIEYSFKLDEFTSREDLIECVKTSMERERIIRKILSPVRLVRRTCKKFFMHSMSC